MSIQMYLTHIAYGRNIHFVLGPQVSLTSVVLDGHLELSQFYICTIDYKDDINYTISKNMVLLCTEYQILLVL